MTNIDSFDHKILELLQNDGRMTITDLSNHIGLSKTPCLKRVQKLEAAGYIRGYKAIINHDLIENNHIAFVQIKLNDTKTIALNAVLKIYVSKNASTFSKTKLLNSLTIVYNIKKVIRTLIIINSISLSNDKC